MANTSSAYSEYVRFTLKSEFAPSLVIDEPIGWQEDDLEIDRHKDYHGIFTSFTNNLKFTKKALEYIVAAYKVAGINADLRLTKDVLVDKDGDVKFVTRYMAIADYNTMVINDNTLTIKFNSNDLAELLKSHESDEFEAERLDSIDGAILPKLITNKVQIEGRSIVQSGESKIKTDTVNSVWFSLYSGNNYITAPSVLINEGPIRHQVVTQWIFGSGQFGYKEITASNFFYVNSTVQVPKATISVRYDLEFEIATRYANQSGPNKIELRKYKYNKVTTFYDLVIVKPIFSETAYGPIYRKANGLFEIEVEWDEALMLVYTPSSPLAVTKQQIIVNEVIFFEQSPELDFVFVHDLVKRLMHIISGRSDSFYSKYFGRKELGYKEDGEGGLIGVMSGLWARAFNKDSEKYKSLTISTKDALDSLGAVFNVGIGIETVNFKERLRVEDLKYFYQDRVVIKLPNQISNVKRSVDSTLFFSGLEFGYERGGDYEDSMGLDEPNTRVSYVTPIRKSKNKFKKLSKIRTDEYGLELARRKPQLLFPDEDTRYDEGNWLLDLKRTIGTGYKQKDYTDRLQQLPTGIHSPSTYRSMHFTPLRMLFRHSWVFSSGLDPYLDRFIKYISSVSNSTLTTWAIGDTKAYAENGDVLCSELQRAKFLPEEVEFDHAVDDELLNLIMGTTTVTINGEKEEVPNYYFKFGYINEVGLIETGYLLNLKPNKTGKFKMQLVNENLIK